MKNKNKITIFISVGLVFVILISVIFIFINGGKNDYENTLRSTPSDNGSSTNSDSDSNIKEPAIEVTDEKKLAIKMATLASIERDVTFDVINSKAVGNNLYHVTLKNNNTNKEIMMEVDINTMEAYQIFTTNVGKTE